LPVPPPLPTSEWLDWRGVCKNGLQNLEPQGVTGQNLDSKEVAPFFYRRSLTCSALTIMRFLRVRRKVRCHMAPRTTVEKYARSYSRRRVPSGISHNAQPLEVSTAMLAGETRFPRPRRVLGRSDFDIPVRELDEIPLVDNLYSWFLRPHLLAIEPTRLFDRMRGTGFCVLIFSNPDRVVSQVCPVPPALFPFGLPEVGMRRTRFETK
jgi:hypothetical protein